MQRDIAMNMLSNYFRSVVNINRSKRILKIKSYENLIKSHGHDKLSELLKNTNTLLCYFHIVSSYLQNQPWNMQLRLKYSVEN